MKPKNIVSNLQITSYKDNYFNNISMFDLYNIKGDINEDFNN